MSRGYRPPARPNAPSVSKNKPPQVTAPGVSDGHVRSALLAALLASAPKDEMPRIMLRELSIYPRGTSRTTDHGTIASDKLSQDLKWLETHLPGVIERRERTVVIKGREQLAAFADVLLEDEPFESIEPHFKQRWSVKPGTLIQAYIGANTSRMLVVEQPTMGTLVCDVLTSYSHDNSGDRREGVRIPYQVHGGVLTQLYKERRVTVAIDQITDIGPCLK